MLHTKFYDSQLNGSGREIFLEFLPYMVSEEKMFENVNNFNIYSHICHVTKLIFINFHFCVLKSFPMKYGYKWSNGFWEKQALIFISEWPGAKVREWPWPWILM